MTPGMPDLPPDTDAVVVLGDNQSVPSMRRTTNCCGGTGWLGIRLAVDLKEAGVEHPYFMCGPCYTAPFDGDLLAAVTAHAEHVELGKSQVAELEGVIGVGATDQMLATLRDAGVKTA